MMVKAVLQDCSNFAFQENEDDKTDWTVVRGTFRKEDGTYLCRSNSGVEMRFRHDAIVYRPKTW